MVAASSGSGRAGDPSEAAEPLAPPERPAPPVERVARREQPQPPPDHATQPIRQGLYVSSNAIALTSLVIVLFTSFAGYINSQVQRIADISSDAARENRGYFIDHITSHGEGTEAPPTPADVRLIAADPAAAFGFFRAIRLNAINVGGTPTFFEREATLHVGGESYGVRLFAQGDAFQDQILSPQEAALIGLADSEDAARVLPELQQFECELEYRLRPAVGVEAEETHRFSFPCRTLPRPD